MFPRTRYVESAASNENRRGCASELIAAPVTVLTPGTWTTGYVASAVNRSTPRSMPAASAAAGRNAVAAACAAGEERSCTMTLN